MNARTAWKKFCIQRRSWWSLWIFLVFYGLACSAPLICNNRPLLVKVDDHWMCPLLFYYPETAFGGSVDLEADYLEPEFQEYIQQNKGWVLWPLLRYGPSTVNMQLDVMAPSPPTEQNWLGTDDQGRDVFTRLLYGLRTSLSFGLILAFCSSCLGIVAGALQGYYGGWVDMIFQRIIEIWSSLPILFVLMIISSILRINVWWLLVIMTLFSWTSLVSVVRAEFLRTRQYMYVKAAQAMGLSATRVMVRHILPNAMSAALSYFPFLVSSSISMLTALDFLGFGLPPGEPSLGELLHQAQSNLFAPWLGLTAFFGVSIILILVVFIGEGLRNAFDPHVKE